MSRILLILEAGYCGWLVWAKFMLERLAVPAEQLATVAAACGVFHCLMAIFYLLRHDRPRSFYPITGFAVYGIFIYQVFPKDMVQACTFGGIGLILLAIQTIYVAFEA